MKFLDKVKVVNDNESYNTKKVFKGMIGSILNAEIRDNDFLVIFSDSKMIEDDIIEPIKIADLELVEERNASDELILDDLPLHNPDWWCKVEDGFIKNLKGEKKNKVAYDYNS